MTSRPLADRVVLITGASRGIGRAVALACAQAGARIVVAAKTVEPHPKLPGTIHTVADEIRALGAEALPVPVDVRSEEQIAALFSTIERTFGRLDALVCNAGAISLTPLSSTPVKRFDLMHEVNARAFFLCARGALPLLRRSTAGHLVSLSPPVSLDPRWLAPHAPYTFSKYGMTLLALGLAGELAHARERISVCCLWPRTTIATAAIEFAVGGPALLPRCRTPQIVADAILEILATTDGSWSGRALLDEDVLRARGRSDFSAYAVDPAHAGDLQSDLFVAEAVGTFT
ncbi:MAG TPA: SDR family oxidoreductase [Opitutaceae bacterium]